MNQSEAIARARELLNAPRPVNSAVAMLAATALAAFAGVLMAGAVVLGPGFDVSEQTGSH